VEDVVRYERRGPAAWVTLDRPEKVNALSLAVQAGLRASLDDALADDDVRVIVLKGAGGNFSSGYDIREEIESGIRGAEHWHRVLTAYTELTMALWEAPKPTIAAVRGWCLAGACELAMACDLIVATEEARFGEPEVLQGSGPVTLLMPFVLGQKKTNELLLTGATLSADEAERAGLINRVVPEERLESAVEEFVARIAPIPLPVLRLTKLALNRAYEAMGLRDAVQINRDLAAILNSLETEEQVEFGRIVSTDGLRAALAWRNGRYPDERSADA
jgi:enoyl-CoA hydratase